MFLKSHLFPYLLNQNFEIYFLIHHSIFIKTIITVQEPYKDSLVIPHLGWKTFVPQTFYCWVKKMGNQSPMGTKSPLGNESPGTKVLLETKVLETKSLFNLDDIKCPGTKVSRSKVWGKSFSPHLKTCRTYKKFWFPFNCISIMNLRF